ncbi:cytoplasmic tRNA 2-thiolation protein 2 isoform X1 [Lithobates pipiens]
MCKIDRFSVRFGDLLSPINQSKRSVSQAEGTSSERAGSRRQVVEEMCEVEERECREVKREEPAGRVGERCMKCRESPAVLIIRVGDAFCRSCFKEYFVHKFRAALGKNRVVFPGEKVLLAYSGGPSSSALIQQVQEGRSRDAPKKLRFIPAILYIDEGAVCGQSWEDRERIVSEIENILKGTSLPYHILSMEQVFSLPESVLQANLPQQDGNYKQAVGSFMGQQRRPAEDGISCAAVTPNPTADIPLAECPIFTRPPAEHTAALRDMFTSIATLTAKQELLHSLRNHLILHVARSNGYSKVMSGESCTRLAVRLLSNISLGRGAFLPLDTGFSDHRYGDVVVVRPMREYSLKEISFYNRLFNVPSVFIPALDTKAPQSSIQNLSESFITKLQADFPSTVSTLYRTSEKLHPSRTDARREQIREERCVLCMCTLDTHTGPSSAFSATQVSERLSGKKSSGCVLPAKDSGKPCCGRGQCSEEAASPTHRITDTPDLVPLLCYSCRLTIKDLNSVDKLPNYILQEGELRSRRLDIRKSIEEFLLDDDPGDVPVM